jgi:branched-chain amino acid transport system substrate-binding protein
MLGWVRRARGALTLFAALIAVMANIAAAQAQEPVKIGFGMSLTGGTSGGGKAALLALQIWSEDINAKGGLLGRPVKLVYYDDQSNPANVPGIYVKLLDVDKVDLVISAYGSNVTVPAMPIVVQRKLLFMSLFAVAVSDQFHYDKYFQISPTGPDPKTAFSEGFIRIAMSMEPKPKTIALVGADAEFSQTALAGARESAKKYGLQIVYDRNYPPTTVDYAPIIRGIQAANPDVVFVGSYPPDSVGMIRAANEVGLKTRMFGGGMIGVQFAAVKAQLGPLLNNAVVYDTYEPALIFPGVHEFLARYQARAASSGVDVLGYYIPPYAYAQMQILEQAVRNVGSLDQDKLGKYIHATTFHTVVGDVTFGPEGEWEKTRVLFTQFQNIQGNDVSQFRDPKKAVILYPPEYKTGTFAYPYSDTKK